MNVLIHQIGEQPVAGFMLVLGRVSPMFLLAPLFSSRLLPVRARAIVAVALALGMAPLALRGGREIPLDVVALGGLMLKEVLVGMAFAFAVAVLFAAVTVAGTFLDTLIGFSYGAVVDPLTGNQNAVMSQVYAMVGVMIFIAIGGDGWMVQGLSRSYDLVPLVDFPSLGALIGGAQHTFSTIFLSAVELAAPVLLALIITDAGFGVVSRVVPQLNVFAVGFPAKIIVGFLIVGASLPFAADWIGNELEASVRSALESLKVVS